MTIVTVERFHDFSAAHRDHLDPGKCGRIHGHNYRIHFKVAAEDGQINERGYAGGSFGDLKALLCGWLEENWDHNLLLHDADPAAQAIRDYRDAAILPTHPADPILELLDLSAVLLPFNPTTEAMALYLLHVVGPAQLSGTGMQLVEVRIEETRKAGATASDLDTFSRYTEQQASGQYDVEIN
jgi:6-pyruvoyltetrahydropterin/6-carboxytetrahydropterin synthase